MSIAIALLNLHVWRRRDDLELNAAERIETRAELGTWCILLAASLLSTLIAAAFPNAMPTSGWGYALLGMVMPVYRRRMRQDTRRSVEARPPPRPPAEQTATPGHLVQVPAHAGSVRHQDAWHRPGSSATMAGMDRHDVDALILGLARSQHGVVARWQLVPAGVPRTLIDERVKRRRLIRVGPSVYQVPGLAGPRRELAGTVLSCGPHAVASHGSAAVLLDAISKPPAHTTVSVSRGHPERRSDVRLCRVKLGPDERTVCDGIPVTTPARTLLDLASELPDRALEQALARSLRNEIATRDQLMKLIARHPRRPGTPRLRALLCAESPPALTRSEAEERFLALVRRAQLPEPQTNVKLHGFEVDFFWRAASVVVEIDGLGYHSSREAQQRDRRRDSALAAAGMRVLRFTWNDITKHPEVTLARVSLTLGRAGG